MYFLIILLLVIRISVVESSEETERLAGTPIAFYRSSILVDDIMKLRYEYLDYSVPESVSLNIVAQNHVDDAELHGSETFTDDCNLNSWSDDGPWEDVCFTQGLESDKMWYKPGELTPYTAIGYEIAIFIGNDDDDDNDDFEWEDVSIACIEGWEESEVALSLILGEGLYTGFDWHAIGCGMSENYCYCWFGEGWDEYNDYYCNGVSFSNVSYVCGGIGVGICRDNDDCVCFPDSVTENSTCAFYPQPEDNSTDTPDPPPSFTSGERKSSYFGSISFLLITFTSIILMSLV